MNDELLRRPDGEGRRVVVFHAQPGSPSDAALQLLTDLMSDAFTGTPAQVPTEPGSKPISGSN